MKKEQFSETKKNGV